MAMTEHVMFFFQPLISERKSESDLLLFNPFLSESLSESERKSVRAALNFDVVTHSTPFSNH